MKVFRFYQDVIATDEAKAKASIALFHDHVILEDGNPIEDTLDVIVLPEGEVRQPTALTYHEGDDVLAAALREDDGEV
jgi:hypothetical protein